MTFEKIVPPNLIDRIFYIENDYKDIWEWSDAAYELAYCQQRT